MIALLLSVSLLSGQSSSFAIVVAVVVQLLVLVYVYVSVCVPGAVVEGTKLLPDTPGPDQAPPAGVATKAIAESLVQILEGRTVTMVTGTCVFTVNVAALEVTEPHVPVITLRNLLPFIAFVVAMVIVAEV